MNCEQCIDKLEALELDFLSDVERFAIRQHIASCPACTQEVERLSQLVSATKSLALGASADKSDALWLAQLEESVWEQADIERKNTSIAAEKHYPLRLVATIAVSVLGLAALAWWISPPQLQPLFARTAIAGVFPSRWSVACGVSSGVSSAHRPVVSGARLFALESHNGTDQLMCLDTSSGQPLWRSPRACLGYLACQDNNVCGLSPSAGDGEIELVMFNAQSGRECWSYRLERGIGAADFVKPQFHGNCVIVVSGGSVTSLEVTSGKRNWHKVLSDRAGCTSVAIRDSSLYIGTTDALYGLSVIRGDVLLSVPYPERMSSLYNPHILLTDSSVILAHRKLNNAGIILCYNHIDRSLTWQHPSHPANHLELIGSMVVVRSQSVTGLDCATGKVRWNIDAGGCSPMAGMGNECLVVSSQGSGQILRINANSGTVVQRYKVEGSCAGMVVSGTSAYLRDNQGILHALDIRKSI